jgi:protein gp37
MGKTKIEYCDETLNIVTGCNHGCSYCYARRLANGRLKDRYLNGGGILLAGDQTDPFAPRFWPQRLEAKLPGKPSVIFLNDMSDAWGKWVPDHVILQMLDFCRHNMAHCFLHLTKNPRRYSDFDGRIPGNCWLGTTITNGSEGRDEYLRAAAEKSRKFISFEPLLDNVVANGVRLNGINWIIIGAQTSPDVQPHTVWVKALLDKAQRMGVPVFTKDNLRLPWINAQRNNPARTDLGKISSLINNWNKKTPSTR